MRRRVAYSVVFTGWYRLFSIEGTIPTSIGHDGDSVVLPVSCDRLGYYFLDAARAKMILLGEDAKSPTRERLEC